MPSAMISGITDQAISTGSVLTSAELPKRCHGRRRYFMKKKTISPAISSEKKRLIATHAK